MRSRFYDCLRNVTSIVYDIVVILAKIDFTLFKFSIRIFDIVHPLSRFQLFMGIVSNDSAQIFYFMERIRQRFLKLLERIHSRRKKRTVSQNSRVRIKGKLYISNN